MGYARGIGGRASGRRLCAPASVAQFSGFAAADDSWFWDTKRYDITGSAPNQYTTHDPFSRALVSFPSATTALNVEAVAQNVFGFDTIDLYTSADPFGRGLTHNQTITFTNYGVKQQIAVTLPAGTRYVEITEGAHLTGLSAAAYSLLPVPASVPRYMVAFGDSISVGNTAIPAQAGYLPGGVRHAPRFDGLIPYGVAGDTLFSETVNGTNIPQLTTRLVSRCSYGSTERALYIQIGTNDYGLDACSAATFQTIYGQVLDGVHAADPTIRIYCQTLFHRSAIPTGGSVIEGANGHGSTWADFNAAITTAVSTRTPWAKVIDGGDQLMTLAQITAAGGLHPNTALHAQIATNILPQFLEFQSNVTMASNITAVLTDVSSNPLTIMGANLINWYKSDSGLTTTSWADQSGGGRNLTGTCSVASSVLNGFNGAQFVAASSNKLVRAQSFSAPGTTPIFFWGVVRQDAWVNNTGRLCGAEPNLNNQIIQSGVSPQLKLFNSAFGPANGGASIGSFKRLEAAFTNSTADYLKLGATTATGTNMGNNTGSQLSLAFGNSAFGSCTWVEFAVFNVVPSGAQLTALDNYVTARYGAGLV